MSRGRRRRNRVTSIWAVVALGAVGLLLLGSLVATLASDGSRGDDQASDGDDPAIQVTPGAEVERLETAVAANPDDVDSMIVLAEVLSNSGRIPESIPWYERAVEIRDSDADLRLAFGQALQRAGHLFDAELQYTRAAEIDPASATAAYFLALLFESQGEPRRDDALFWYRRVVEIDPASVLADQARGRIQAAEPAASPTTGP